MPAYEKINFEGRLEVTDGRTSVCSAMNNSFCGVQFYSLVKKESLKSGFRLASRHCPLLQHLYHFYALINELSPPRTLTNRRSELLSDRHYELLEGENQPALATLALQLR